jgi:pimeloyl-ACP methyl ester carboxylesterase
MTGSEASAAFSTFPYRIDISDSRLDMIRERIRAFRWNAWIEPPDAADWRYGPPAAFMRELCDYWLNQYDWRQHERAMNEWPHFTTLLDDLDIHFVHEQGSGPSSIPLLIAHGWPYSFHSYDGLIDRLAHPERHGGLVEDAFSVVIPSYPGYDFSGRPQRPMGPLAIALLFDKLMSRLGYDRYLVHGGDWGAHITSLLGFHLPDRVMGIHSTALALREAGAEQLSGEVPNDATEEQRAFVGREQAIWQQEGAYSQLHATKAAKIGYAMMDSPVGLAAWIVEAFHAWSDRSKHSFAELFTPDQLLTEVMLYLVTDAFPTSIWIYGAKRQEAMTLPPGQTVIVPTGLAAFPDPVFPMPPRQVAQRSHNLVQYTEMPFGGHFPFYEAPELLIEDIRQFRKIVAPVVKSGSCVA